MSDGSGKAQGDTILAPAVLIFTQIASDALSLLLPFNPFDKLPSEAAGIVGYWESFTGSWAEML